MADLTWKLYNDIVNEFDNNGTGITKLHRMFNVSKLTIRIWLKERLNERHSNNQGWVCEFCSKTFTDVVKFKIHQHQCKNNPDRKPRKQHSNPTNRIVSEETRKKISEGRKNFLKNNPDKHSYNILRGKESYPETYFSKIFEERGIVFEKQAPVSSYRLDFYFPGRSVDFEVDGEQHYTDPRIVESDKRRTEFLNSKGIEVIRIRWSEYNRMAREQKEDYVNNLMTFINSQTDNVKPIEVEMKKYLNRYIVGLNKSEYSLLDMCGFGYSKIKFVKPYIKSCGWNFAEVCEEQIPEKINETCSCGNCKKYNERWCLQCEQAMNEKIERHLKLKISKEELFNLSQTLSISAIARMYSVSFHTVKKRLKKFGLTK